MKMKKIFLMLCLALPLGFVSCGDDDEANTHTDASPLVAGTYMGTMENADGQVVASDVIVTITKNETANVQSVNMTLKSAALNMDQTGIFNVAKAGNNRYTFGSGSIATTAGSAIKYSGGVLEGISLTFYVTMSSSYKFSVATAAKRYTMKLVRQ